MIKLVFSKFNFTTDGTTSKGSIIATIKYYLDSKYRTVSFKEFKTKITLKKGDKPDLNKAYKHIIAKLERDAYAWAGEEAFKELLRTQKTLKVLDDFNRKASHIVVHDNHYLETL